MPLVSTKQTCTTVSPKDQRQPYYEKFKCKPDISRCNHIETLGPKTVVWRREALYSFANPRRHNNVSITANRRQFIAMKSREPKVQDTDPRDINDHFSYRFHYRERKHPNNESLKVKQVARLLTRFPHQQDNRDQ
ncbi:BAH_G0016100.mRNA.1.CDS.1 [Saccharomyces cerevisiae]|nr:BAH_G0016100.mRNA.1.CDS.1 [Saccharomyces cerevisiae]CAI7110816.1 BAH_G0016100.mRNA.1.CDS.1 [Saccharomyces cerevisiae]